MKRAALIAYLLAVHAAIAVLVVRPDIAPRVLTRLAIYDELPAHARSHRQFVAVDSRQPEGVVVFLGDSITAALATAAIADRAVNYGIGGLTSTELARHVPYYHSIARARAVSIAIGVNDVARGDAEAVPENVRRIIDGIPQAEAVVLTGIFPAPAFDRNTIGTANAALSDICAARPGCTYIDVDSLLSDPKFYRDDRIHINDSGYAAWADALREAL